MTTSPNDGQLIKRLQNGELEALGVLYERHKNPVYRTALAITRDPTAAEDILQDCFLRLYKYAYRVDSSRPLRPWLYRVTVNLSYTWETCCQRWQTPQDGMLEWIAGPPDLCPEWQVEMHDIQRKMMKAINSLSFNQCLVIILYYLNSLSLNEIAQIMDCPVGTVKSRLYYGRENLHRKMQVSHNVTPEMLYAFN